MAALGGGWVVVQVLEECRDGLSSFRLIAVDGREDSQSDVSPPPVGPMKMKRGIWNSSLPA